MRGFDIKQIPMRPFQISGLTAKWGIGGSRKPSIWDANLIGRWDARTFPDGELATIPNTATMEGKSPDITVEGATMKKGTLQFDGVDDGARTSRFLFPERFTVFWDIDWLGTIDTSAGVIHGTNLIMYNLKATESLLTYIRSAPGKIPNTRVGVSTNGKVYAKDGSVTPFGGTVGTGAKADELYIAQRNTAFTQMGFRQLLIFNKELSQDEVNDVLRAMFPA
jgi:hypothetical protein|nr:MAG TPA: hypothetical protein [Caudoviricetes sp.]